MTQAQLIELNKNLSEFAKKNNIDDVILVFLNNKDNGAIGVQFVNHNHNKTMEDVLNIVVSVIGFDGRKKLHEGIIIKH